MKMYGYHYRYVKPSTYICAFAFSLMIFILLVSCIVVSFMSAGPMVLGTEMNIDGTVEYLCLGADCEALGSVM